MDPSPPEPRRHHSRPIPSPQSARTTSNVQTLQGSNDDGVGFRPGAHGSLRRERSDGDVFGPPLRGSVGDRRTEEETWIDFLQESSRPEGTAGNASLRHSIPSFGSQEAGRRPDRQAAMQRAALIMADRKRRLTENQEDYSRRRSVSSLPFGPATSASRSGLPPSRGHVFPLAGPIHPSSSSILDRPLPRRPDVATPRSHGSREITLPRWQPDSEVTSCPICGTNFGFWYRKHHCRKCGRVVCANCSPHRITIPRQFIVQPPQGASQTVREGISGSIEVVDLTEDDDIAAGAPRSNTESHDTPQSPQLHIDPALGGGQEVRLCNPCVPDPNPLPHLPFESPDRTAIHSFPRPSFDRPQSPDNATPSEIPPRSSSTRQSSHRRGLLSPNHGDGPPGSIAGPREEEVDFLSFPSRRSCRLPPNYSSLYGSVPNGSLHERNHDSMLPSALHLRHRHHASASNVPSPSRYRSLSDTFHSSLATPRPLPRQQAPQPQLREEDECPICHHALPPKGPEGGETTREAHVASCIEQHFSSSVPRAARPHPSVATEAAVAASGAIATSGWDRGGGNTQQRHDQRTGNERVEQSSSSSNNAFPRTSSQKRRGVGMFKYLATEKDCIAEGGEPAECVICFEEFEQGVEMGRLECLCKFHKACIRQWWDTKGPGSCPVHQGGLD